MSAERRAFLSTYVAANSPAVKALADRAGINLDGVSNSVVLLPTLRSPACQAKFANFNPAALTPAAASAIITNHVVANNGPLAAALLAAFAPGRPAPPLPFAFQTANGQRHVLTAASTPQGPIYCIDDQELYAATAAPNGNVVAIIDCVLMPGAPAPAPAPVPTPYPWGAGCGCGAAPPFRSVAPTGAPASGASAFPLLRVAPFSRNAALDEWVRAHRHELGSFADFYLGEPAAADYLARALAGGDIVVCVDAAACTVEGLRQRVTRVPEGSGVSLVDDLRHKPGARTLAAIGGGEMVLASEETPKRRRGCALHFRTPGGEDVIPIAFVRAFRDEGAPGIGHRSASFAVAK